MLLDDFSFQVSPTSFFQTNTESCIVLYDLVKQLLNEEIAFYKKKYGERTKIVLLDVCCGVGSIGLVNYFNF